MGQYGIIASIIIGAIAGWIASKIMGKDAQMGGFANIIVGILGGGIGNWLFMKLFNSAATNLAMQIIYAVIGAVILLFIVGKIMDASKK
ncbi:GlsB/YeaQ/YmgE family stress response membrane protein [uncultured Anaerococcus sp.]|uniref:GlsB/YeaQ/YmgE family stress response membrane protein n=1 Tax=uncultured Anaerococcus sp. TaxID=293428 RepID=UPI00280B7C6C|nr:GlsB/YeaQ/YmgE family stress response membrane protein [uncultured Anaerococcus sp.]MDU5149261.1 GlsB/YeaQ/YmgE family stress response membrane protein [Anaerococcus prevotii]